MQEPRALHALEGRAAPPHAATEQGGARGSPVCELRQTTPEWKSEYRRRAGIEGTFSWAVGLLGARRARYRGLEKVSLEHVLTAVALSILRVTEWLGGVSPPTSRVSAFARIAA